MAQLAAAAQAVGVAASYDTAPERFRDLLRVLHARTGRRVVVLADVHFTLLSGVSKFSMASVFSGLNNLTDITLDPCYSAICGYTEADLDTVFTPELPGLDRERIRHWYYGYNWRGAERVYNPFDILLLFDKRGRADMAVRLEGNVCLFEFKVVEQASAGAALAQLRERGYADKYRASGDRIHLIGVEFSKETRNVTAFEVERA